MRYFLLHDYTFVQRNRNVHTNGKAVKFVHLWRTMLILGIKTAAIFWAMEWMMDMWIETNRLGSIFDHIIMEKIHVLITISFSTYKLVILLKFIRTLIYLQSYFQS